MDEFRIFTGLNAYTDLYMMIDHLLTYIKQFIKERVKIYGVPSPGYRMAWTGENFSIMLDQMTQMSP